MKGSIRWIPLLAALALAGSAVPAQQVVTPAPAPASAPDRKNGTGSVPPGIKLQPQMPAAGSPQPFHFPQAATKTLPNGLRVFVITDHSEPAIAARLVILSGGSIKDPSTLR